VSGARTNLSNALICSLYVRDRKSAALRGAEPSSRTAASVNLRLGWARGACDAMALRALALLAAAVDGRVCDGKYIHDQYDSEYTAVNVGIAAVIRTEWALRSLSTSSTHLLQTVWCVMTSRSKHLTVLIKTYLANVFRSW